MTEIELREARSFPGLKPPNDAQKIFWRRTDTGTYIYYQDSEGNLYYATEEGLAFEAHMQEVQKCQRQQKLRGILNGEVAPVQQKHRKGEEENEAYAQVSDTA